MIKSNRMRGYLMILAGGTALALPAGEAAASPATSAKFTGPTVPAHQWGTVTVNVTMKTTGAGIKASHRFIDLGGGYTFHTSRSQYIMSQALPILRQEFLTAQSARIQNVSGATYTSQAFTKSLQAALLKAHV
jgi:hypothetical protein